MKQKDEWKIYRTRFLIRARQLTEPIAFIDALGREHRGETGDYLVESSDGTMRVTAKAIFEDIYVAMTSTYPNQRPLKHAAVEGSLNGAALKATVAMRSGRALA